MEDCLGRPESIENTLDGFPSCLCLFKAQVEAITVSFKIAKIILLAVQTIQFHNRVPSGLVRPCETVAGSVEAWNRGIVSGR